MQFCLACLVIFSHLFFFAHLLIAKKEPVRKSREHRLVVKTKSSSPTQIPQPTTMRTSIQQQPKTKVTPAPSKTLQPKPVQLTAKPVPPNPVSQVPAQKKTQISSKPKSPKGKAITPTQPKTKPSPKARSTPSKRQLETENSTFSTELVQQLQESIAKIEKKPDKYRAEEQFVLPEKLAPVANIDNAYTAFENSRDFLAGVKEELIHHLHMALHLPDFGEVKVQLELNEIGNVQNVKVLKAASQRNREYLEKELPRISFSSLVGRNLSVKDRTFVISFHNEV